jgi:hypothetical protein
MSEKPILIVNDKSYDEAMHYDRMISVQVFDLTLTETLLAMHVAPTGERQPSSKGYRLQGKASVDRSLSVAGSDKVSAREFTMALEAYNDDDPPEGDHWKDRAKSGWLLSMSAGADEGNMHAYIGNEAYNELVSAVRSTRRFSLSIFASLDDAWVNMGKHLHFRPIEGQEHYLLASGLITSSQIREPSVKSPPIELSWRDALAMAEQNKDAARIAASSYQAKDLLVEITRKSKAASAALMEDHKASEQRYQESVKFLGSLIRALNPRWAADDNDKAKASAGDSPDIWSHQKLEDILVNGNGRTINDDALTEVADEYLRRRWLHSAEIELLIVGTLAYNDAVQFAMFLFSITPQAARQYLTDIHRLPRQTWRTRLGGIIGFLGLLFTAAIWGAVGYAVAYAVTFALSRNSDLEWLLPAVAVAALLAFIVIARTTIQKIQKAAVPQSQRLQDMVAAYELLGTRPLSPTRVREVFLAAEARGETWERSERCRRRWEQTGKCEWSNAIWPLLDNAIARDSACWPSRE